MRTQVARRVRRLSKLSKGESERAVAFIKDCARNQPYPVPYTARMLGCTYRTAQRILGIKTPYTSRLRRLYAVRFATNTGLTFEQVAKPEDPEYEAAFLTWATANPASHATKCAALLGAGISTRAMIVYGMLADFSVRHALDGRPSCVAVQVTDSNGTIHTLSIRGGSSGGVIMDYTGSGGAVLGQVTPSPKRVDAILKNIYNARENIQARKHR